MWFPRKNHQMQTRSEAWELFKEKVHVPIKLRELKGEILRKCNGLPQAILTLGETLSNISTTAVEWLNVLNQMNQNKCWALMP